jgi:hypothetical protein
MLLDGADEDAEVIHPYGMRGGEPPERELADAAHRSAVAMVTEGQLGWALEEGYYHLVPAQKHIAHVTLVEVYRLKYRPHTKATAAWLALMTQTAAEYLRRYQQLTKREDEQDAISRNISRLNQG